MQILKRILYGLLALAALICLLFISSAFLPGLADSMRGFFDGLSGDSSVVSAQAEPEGGGNLHEGLPAVSETPEPAFTPAPTSAPLPAPLPVYTLPEKSEIVVPEEVSGRTGYAPVQEETRSVDEHEAEQIQEALSAGETGEDLTFDPLFYPYYAMLDEPLQALYRQIYSNVLIGNSRFAPAEPATMAQFRPAFIAVFCDHPELFWMECAYSGTIDGNRQIVEVVLSFNETADRLGASKAAFEGAAEEILQNGRHLGSAYEKETYVHNALLGRLLYDLGAPLNQSAYSALVNGRTVCSGYSKAFQYLMRELGVPCYFCIGYAGESHAWNVIQLEDDAYYNVDTTWNDTDPNTLDYFNRTDREFAKDHIREDLSVYLPACNGTQYGGPSEEPPESSMEPSAPADAPVTPEQAVFTTMEDYYADCYRQIMESGGSVRFQNKVDASLLKYFEAANQNKATGDGYMDRIAEELHASAWEVQVEGEEQPDGTILLTHTVLLRLGVVVY